MERLDNNREKPSQRLSYVVLCTGLILVTVLFGVRASYAAGVYYALVVAQLAAICIAAWKLGAWAVRAESEERRRLAVAGGLLVMPWAFFSFLTGFSAPQFATHPENQLRYVILMINAIALTGGLVVLWQALNKTGERFYSTLGFAAIVLASPLYIIFVSIQLLVYRTMERAGSEQAANGFASLDELSLILLYFGVVLTYLAAASFASALEKVHWLGRTARRAFVGTNVFAVLCVSIKMAEAFASPHNLMWGFKTWYMIPGFVFSIPAVPWIMPCMFGVVLLRRAGQE